MICARSVPWVFGTRADGKTGVLDWHRNEGIEFTFLAAKLPFALDRRAVTLEPGDLTITRPWQRHRVGHPEVPASRLIWLILDVGVRRPNQPWRWPKWLLLPPVKMQRLTHQLRHNEQIAWRANRATARCFEAIGAAAEMRPDADNLTRLKMLINELLLSLADLLEERRPRLDANLSSAERTVKLFLDELPRRVEEPWTLEEMARQCGLGRSHFSHYCRKLTNRTPMRHLTVCRVEKACELMCRDSRQHHRRGVRLRLSIQPVFRNRFCPAERVQPAGLAASRGSPARKGGGKMGTFAGFFRQTPCGCSLQTVRLFAAAHLLQQLAQGRIHREHTGDAAVMGLAELDAVNLQGVIQPVHVTPSRLPGLGNTAASERPGSGGTGRRQS